MINHKNNKKSDVRQLLLSKGRELVVDKGPEFLTARKLSEASGCSVGTIYNQFANMDNFVVEQNMQTLQELYLVLGQILPDSDFYKNLNRAVDAYVGWIVNNKNLWLLLFDFHRHNDRKMLPWGYRRKIGEFVQLWDEDFARSFAGLNSKERKISRQVLMLALFTMSSFLLVQNTGKISKRNICKLLLNTYLAGLEVLKRVK